MGIKIAPSIFIKSAMIIKFIRHWDTLLRGADGLIRKNGYKKAPAKQVLKC